MNCLVHTISVKLAFPLGALVTTLMVAVACGNITLSSQATSPPEPPVFTVVPTTPLETPTQEHVLEIEELEVGHLPTTVGTPISQAFADATGSDAVIHTPTASRTEVGSILQLPRKS